MVIPPDEETANPVPMASTEIHRRSGALAFHIALGGRDAGAFGPQAGNARRSEFTGERPLYDGP